MTVNTSPLHHNNPPSDAEILQQALQDNNAALLAHADALAEAANRIPAEITDDETAGRASDYIKQVTAAAKKLEAVRVSEKEPFLQQGRLVDGFFKKIDLALAEAKQKALRPLDAFTKRKAEDERKRLRDEAEAARAKAEAEQAAAAVLEQQNAITAADDMLTQATITDIGAARLEKLAEAKPAEMSRTRGDEGALASLRTVWVGELENIGALDLEVLRHLISPDAYQKAINAYVRAGGRELRGAKIFEQSTTVVR